MRARAGARMGAGCFAAVLAGCSSSSPSGLAGDGGADVSLLDGTAADAASRDGSYADAAAADAPGGDASEAGADGAPPGDAGDGAAGDAGDCPVGAYGEAMELRCAGLYSDWGTKTVSPDTHPFDPGLHLWSDGAVKTRWIYLPPDPAGDGGPGGPRLPIDTSNMDEWTFPVGTKFWKEFVLQGRRIETRLIWKLSTGSWYKTTYRWSADESSATELLTGELDADGNGYEVPSQGACETCHGGREDDVLGFEAVSLSSAGATPFTMQTLAAQGWITSVPDAAIVIPGNATDVAALGYLHANCGTACHNSGYGQASGTGFYMRLEVAKLGSVQATDTWQTGVNRSSYVTLPGATDPLLLLAPGDAGASCVHYRMSTRTSPDGTGAGIQMPPIDTHKVDEAGVALVGAWIEQGCQ